MSFFTASYRGRITNYRLANNQAGLAVLARAWRMACLYSRRIMAIYGSYDFPVVGLKAQGCIIPKPALHLPSIEMSLSS